MVADGRALTILGVHKRDAPNIGDMAASPLLYRTLGAPGDREILGDAKQPPEDVRPDVVVFGGGAIAKYAPRVRRRYPNSLLIAWGVGFTFAGRRPVRVWSHLFYRTGFALWGQRDHTAWLGYVPCASCLHPLLADPPRPQHDVVAFGHETLSPLSEECARLSVPYMSNLDPGGVDAAIAFLASGSTVVSSSFHGAYWGTLLGRRTAMIPFGAKFHSLRDRPPAVASVEEGLRRASAFPGALGNALAVTRRFEHRVREAIARRRENAGR